MTGSLQLIGKVCIITGGTRGIGLACARALAQQGASCVVIGRTSDAVEEVARMLYIDNSPPSNPSGNGNWAWMNDMPLSSPYSASSPVPLPRHLGIACDIKDDKQMKAAIDNVEKTLGCPSVLVNAAGISIDGLLLRTKEEDLHNVINTNLVGTMRTTQHVLSKMIRHNEAGSIISIGSVVGGQMGSIGQSIYGASKAGLAGFTKCLAKEVGSRGIKVNLIEPGFITTDMTGDMSAERKKDVSLNIPLGKFGTTSEVAKLVTFLAGSNTYITGQSIVIDGGLSL